MIRSAKSEQTTLNAICPYFTMFPLQFPLSILRRKATPRTSVLDPFCGRGTTNFAARVLRLPTVGLDISPIAVAATGAKLVSISDPDEIVSEAKEIILTQKTFDMPKGKFWSLAYNEKVLIDICKLRAALIDNCRGKKRKALRGIILGALHGPLRKNGTSSSYFSNQCPRTYAPKPGYAVNFWRRVGLCAPKVDVMEIIASRAVRYFEEKLPDVRHRLLCADSRIERNISDACKGYRPKLIVTSPPYYGLRTYISDQWLRSWFLGGAASSQL